MAKIHVLTGNGSNNYTVVVHIATPGGSNSAGVAWSTAVVNSGRNATVMPEGSGAGQITTAEKTGVVAGTTLEGVFTFTDNPAWSGAQRNAALDAAATQCTDELLARYAAELKWVRGHEELSR